MISRYDALSKSKQSRYANKTPMQTLLKLRKNRGLDSKLSRIQSIRQALIIITMVFSYGFTPNDAVSVIGEVSGSSAPTIDSSWGTPISMRSIWGEAPSPGTPCCSTAPPMLAHQAPSPFEQLRVTGMTQQCLLPQSTLPHSDQMLFTNQSYLEALP